MTPADNWLALGANGDPTGVTNAVSSDSDHRQMTKINTVTKSRKPLTCRICCTDLPVGSSYTWVAHFRQPKMVHCTDCSWKNSELTGSDLQTRAWEAIETMVANLQDWDGRNNDWSDLQSWAQDCEDSLQEVADEYEAACDAFENGTPPSQLEELRDSCSNAASDCDIDCCASDWGEDHCDDLTGDELPREGDEFDAWVTDTRENLMAHFLGLLDF